MADRSLQRLSKSDLLDIIYQMKKNEEAMTLEMQKLRAENEKKNYDIKEAGSIAEAAIRVNGVFEASQAAADMYLEQAKIVNSECGFFCAELITRTEKECREMREKADAEIAEKWSEFYSEIISLRQTITDSFATT